MELIFCTRRLLKVTKSHLNNHICQHCGVKPSTVTPSFYCVFNISLSCNYSIRSFIGNLWRVLFLGNHLKECSMFLTRNSELSLIFQVQCKWGNEKSSWGWGLPTSHCKLLAVPVQDIVCNKVNHVVSLQQNSLAKLFSPTLV